MFSEWLQGLSRLRSADESYEAGRQHAAIELANAANYESTVRSLWARAGKQRALGVGSHFDKGIADVLTEQGSPCPNKPL